jgi:hypothetical protein
MLRPFVSDPREQQAVRYFGDGLFDLALGAALALIALLMARGGRMGGLVAIVPVLASTLLIALKHAITTPRLAGEELPPGTEQRLRLATTSALIVVGVLLVLGLLVFALINAGSIVPVPVPLAGVAGGIMVVLLLLLGVFGWAGGARRFGAYIALALLLTAASFWLQLGLTVPLLALGLVIGLSGLVVLNRFLHTHPRLQGGPA